MKKLFIIVLLIVGLLIPVVSANDFIIDEFLEDSAFTGGKTTFTGAEGGHSNINAPQNQLIFKDITKCQSLYYVAIDTAGDKAEGRDLGVPIPFEYTLNGETKTGRYYIDQSKNLLGTVTSTRFTLFFDDWDVSGLLGEQTVNLNQPIYTLGAIGTRGVIVTGDPELVRLPYVEPSWGSPHHITVSSAIQWKGALKVYEAETGEDYWIELQREFLDGSFVSTIDVYDVNDENTLSNHNTNDYTTIIPKDRCAYIILTTPGGKEYRFDIGDSAPIPDDAIPVNIRVQNSQTGALLANAHVNITANVNGTFHEVVNETLPAGTKTYYLQPTGGGLPNPDFYRLVATVEGYNPIMPYIDFEADIATTIYAYLNPVGGAPVDVNKTFIDFYVRDLNANPVAGATVKFGAYTLLTNSAGYTIFEVEKDKNYTWIVSKSGYGSVTGNAAIGSNDRYTINAVIAPAVTPTLPTTIPTKTPVKPTPTMTAPTGEPVSNLLEWFAAHFGMLLGGGVEVGKIFMWLCFTIPAGVFVGKEAKAGAAGFMAGAGIVTLFFVIIGWVPIWLVVILALIIGLLYAKAFSNIGNGGGR